MRSQPEVPKAASDAEPGASLQRLLMRAFPWHVRAFLVANLALTIVNAMTGRPWWAFWPLMVTSLVLAVHYLFYKAAAVDDRWVEQRIEELNLKSYDRGHIENLKSRYDPGKPPEDHQR